VIPVKILEDYKTIAGKCLRCSLCKFIPQVAIMSQEFSTVCPSIDRYNFHGFSGGGRLIMALALMSGRLEFTQDVADVIYKCTSCGGCDVACKYLNTLEPLDVIQAVRERAVQLKAGPMPAHRAYIQRVVDAHNPYGEDHGKRFAWMPRDVKVTDVARTAYFVGCTSAYRRKEVAVATARLLSKAGVEFTVLGDGEFCCGSPLLRVGDRAAFEDAARHNIDALQRMGIRRVVMSCAGCYSAFKVHYPEVRRFGFKVVHTSQLFSELIREGRLKLSKEVAEVATYHDPCHLGRCAEPRRGWHGVEFKVLTFVRLSVPPRQFRRGNKGVFEEPRDAMMRVPGLRLVEMERRREYAYCCGAGGGVKAAFPEFAGFTVGNRLKEAKKTGAGMIVTTCPFCITNFKDGIRESGGGMRCLDLSELLLEATGGRAD